MSDTWAMFIAGMRAYYRLNSDRIAKLESESIAEIERMKMLCHNPYLAYSSGKDSTLMLWLVRKVYPGISCIWIDEWDTQDTHDQLDLIEQSWGHTIYRARYRFHPEFFAYFGVQPVLAQNIRIDIVGDTLKDIPPSLGFDGVFVGMRRDESVNRDRVLRHRQTQYLKGKEIVRCSPLGEWRLEDVWAYSVHHDLPLHAGYAKQINLGIEPKRARVGALSIVRVYQFGTSSIAKMLYPHEWAAMVEANPCMGSE